MKLRRCRRSHMPDGSARRQVGALSRLTGPEALEDRVLLSAGLVDAPTTQVTRADDAALASQTLQVDTGAPVGDVQASVTGWTYALTVHGPTTLAEESADIPYTFTLTRFAPSGQAFTEPIEDEVSWHLPIPVLAWATWDIYDHVWNVSTDTVSSDTTYNIHLTLLVEPKYIGEEYDAVETWLNLTVLDVPDPDLMGTYFGVNRPVTWGQSITVDAGIWNAGGKWSAWTTAEFYLSNDGTIGNADDLFLGWTGVGPVAPGETAWIDDLDLLMPYALPAGYSATSNMYIGMVIDPYDRVTELSDTNNSNRGPGLDGAWAAPGLCDLLGTSFNAADPMAWGGPFYVDATVTNYGNGWSGWTPVEFYLSNDGTIGDADDVFLGWTGVAPLAPGTSVTLHWHELWMPGAAPAGYADSGWLYVGMVADPGDWYTEWNDTNNANQGIGLDGKWMQLAHPDLAGASFLAPGQTTWGEWFTVNAAVTNWGNAWSGWAPIEFYLSSDGYIGNADDVFLGWTGVGPLAPGAIAWTGDLALWLPHDVPAGFPLGGNVYVGMVVDPGNWYVEWNETNNANIAPGIDGQWVGQRLPDLMGTAFDATEPHAWGQPVTVNATVTNYGNWWSGWAPVEFYLSSDGTIGNADDVFLGWSGVGPLAPGASATIGGKQLLLPGAPPGGYTATDTVFIGMVVDPGNWYVEWNDLNNASLGDGLDGDWVAVSALTKAFSPTHQGSIATTGLWDDPGASTSRGERVALALAAGDWLLVGLSDALAGMRVDDDADTRALDVVFGRAWRSATIGI
jgi:CARDB protein